MEKLPLPTLSELFSDMNPVIAAFLKDLDSPYGYWYPVDDKGEVDEGKAKAMYLAYQKELGDDELTGLMPLMRYQPVRGVESYMLDKRYDEEKHLSYDIKDAPEFLSKRRAMGPAHRALRTCGSSTIFGGLESRLDDRSVIQGPLFVGHKWTVRASAKIIGPSLMGDRTLLNTSSVFTRSVIGDDSQVDDLAVIKDALIGRGVYVMVGARLLHRTGLNDTSITISEERRQGRGIHTHTLARRKMGCVVGDGCVIGSNAVLDPGTMLLPGVRIPNGLIVPSGIYDQPAINRLAGKP